MFKPEHRFARSGLGAAAAVTATCALAIGPMSTAAHATPKAATPTTDSASTTASVTSVDNDEQGTAWYSNQPNLSPANITSGSFGQLFATTLQGDIQAQPLVANGVLLVETESDDAYGLNPVTGKILWQKNVGVPWNPALISCDAAPTEGITGTPVVVNGIEYFLAKSDITGSTTVAEYSMHALSVTTGAEQPGFPKKIAGNASNDPTESFNGTDQLQRPGLIYTGGVVYAAFGGSCDHPPTHGWLVGVNPSGKITSMWSDEADPPTNDQGLAGIWAPGGLRSPGVNQLLFASGNGDDPTAAAPDTPGSTVPGLLGEAVADVTVQSTGKIVPKDFFIPYDAPHLNANDGDLGSGAPIILPSQFTTAKYPRLAVQIGKEGYLYVINLDQMGGYQQGPDGGDNVVARLGPVQGVWGDLAVYGGEGGYLYMVVNGGAGASIPGPSLGRILVWKFGVSSNGTPTFAQVGQSQESFPYGASSPVITSTGTQPGSAVLWVNWVPQEYSPSAQLQAFSAVPDSSGNLDMIWSAPSGAGAKLSTPGVANGRVYVGGDDGVIRGFGSPVQAPMSGGSLTFPNTKDGNSSTLTDTFTATTPLTVTKVTESGSDFTLGSPTPALPATLNPTTTGDTSFSIPVTFTPSTDAESGGTITVTTSAGTYVAGVAGYGLASGPLLTADPTFLSLEGTPVGTVVTHDLLFENQGSAPLTITGGTVPVPSSPFQVMNLPPIGSVLQPGQTVAATVEFAPTATGTFDATVTVNSDAGGSVSVPLSGAAAVPGDLQITPTTLTYGPIAHGTTQTKTFVVKNIGGTNITITKSHPPTGNGFTSLTAFQEGTVLTPGQSVTISVEFAPTAAGSYSDVWPINGNGSNPSVINVEFKGTAT